MSRSDDLIFVVVLFTAELHASFEAIFFSNPLL